MQGETATSQRKQSLLEQQNALLGALFAPPRMADAAQAALNVFALPTTWNQRGLLAYRANGQALAERALGAVYPVMRQLLGADSFAALAASLWHAHPPRCGDLAQWGDTLADHLAAHGPLDDEPYLPDVAHVEWTLHSIAPHANVSGDLASLQRLVNDDPATLQARLAPGCAVLPSRWPVASIVMAHREAEGSEPSAESLLELGQRMQRGDAETAIIWRHGYAPSVRPALPGEADFIAALLGGASLAQALDTTQGSLDLMAWLPQAAHSGLLLGVDAWMTK